jgi:hypothetical protein
MSAPAKPVGFKLSFANAKNKNALKPATQPLAKRPRLLDDDAPEEAVASQEISGFDISSGGAIDLNGAKKEEKKALVIPGLPNRNWQAAAAAAKRKRDPRPEETKKEEVHEEEKVSYGLTFIKKAEAKAEEVGEEKKVEEPQDDGLTEEQRLEKRALSALLHGKPTDEGAVIPIDEEAAFEHDFANAPDAPSLDDYEAVPVEGFGAALLRGMGWKDGEELGRKRGGTAPKPREVKRRAEFLGIGAKEESAVKALGGWQRGKEKPTYQPVVLKNKVTGETISEEELKAKLEQQKLVAEEEKKGGGKRRYEIEEGDRDEEERRSERKRRERRDRDRDRSPGRDEKRRDRESDRRRDEDSRDSRDRRDRSRDRDGRRKERRCDDDYSDERKSSRRTYDYSDDERRREKRRERERRDRSRSPDSDDRRKRRRDYDDEPEDRKRRHRDDGYRR